MSGTADGALLTDLYELTMVHAYFREGMNGRAVFELFLHKRPPQRNFLISAGLEQALGFLETLAFSPDDCRWLYETGRFDRQFVDFLEDLRFRGDVYAMPEGTVFFEREPILRVEAALPEAQIVETRLINLIQFQTLVASKAARSVLAAPGKQLVDFGLRRAHGAEAGMLAARASFLAGFSGTSNVAAAREFGIPMYGTMAHSYIMAHANEAEAFRKFAAAQPGNIVLLIDTYDTEAGARQAADLARELAPQGLGVASVRIDSGDLAEESFRVRRILDAAGQAAIQIFASGDLDEFELQRIIRRQAPIDGFGIGTRMVTAADAPYLDCVYKLQEYAGRPRFKRSPGKQTLPGARQVFRLFDAEGRLDADLLTTARDAGHAYPLLQPVMRAGRRLSAPEPPAVIRERVVRELKQLPDPFRRLEPGGPSPVRVSEELQKLALEHGCD